ncbi:hypothetical protein [Mycolicibacterium lutetiense]|uniref:Uncharacterized protein n=1 Tax=Mycolicibacterium lutetiense TaxID=1641992 RepID=A0ABS4ZL54_9MYCO|nr:hypothetical protein [Mycolicibacterium lutetiense]MBP2450232.1 hypothetical protein [Mycolicibacterium lutetiense]
MKRLRWLGIVVIVLAVGAGMLWLLWPQPRPPIVAEATAGPYLVRFEPRMPQIGLTAPAVEATPIGEDDYRADIDLSAPRQWDITAKR